MDAKQAPSNLFHAHLDTCQQCRENPAFLCEGGHAALRISVHGRDAIEEILNEPPRVSPMDLMGIPKDEQKIIKEVAADVLGPWAQFVR